MKISNTIKIIALGIVILFTSCGDFGDTNINPDTPTTVEPPFLITNTLYQLADQTTRNGFIFGSTLMQYHGEYDLSPVNQYKIESNTTLWVNDNKYLGDLNDILNDKKTNTSIKAITKILKAIIGAQLTDLYGPVPFFEAGYKNILKPKYDKQKDIYTATNGVLDLLSQAKKILSSDTGIITGDILFNGNKDRWIKFANVLQLRYLLRISAVYPKAKQDIQKIITANQIFKSNKENVVLKYTQEPNNWFLSKVRSGDFKLYTITTTILKMLQDRQDPRILFYYKPNSLDKYIGIPPGSTNRDGKYTSLSDNYRASDIIDMIFLTYFQQEFILSEAALKNYIDPTTAQQHYENAVKAAFAYRNVLMPADYLTNPTKGKWKGTLENIIHQKYLANIMIGYESWFDYRRTGFPKLSPALNNSNSDKIPIRFKYPSEETFTNKKHNLEAISWLGGANNYNSKSWWDKK